MGFYANATTKVSLGEIPWQALAAIHYREAEFMMSSKIPGGPFQLDPGGTGDELKRRIEEYVRKVTSTYSMPYQKNMQIDS